MDERTAWIEGFAGILSAARELVLEGPDSAIHCACGSEIWAEVSDLGCEVYYYGSISSTNDRLRDLAAEGAPRGTVVVADSQTAGRGRHGRVWYSPPGSGIYSSLLLRPEIGADRVGWITLGAALALVRIAGRYGISLNFKWPNDVESEGRKVAGILAETVSEGSRVVEVVLGTGINVNWDEGEVPEDILRRATALSMRAPAPLDRDRLLAEYLWELWGIVAELESERGTAAPAVANEVMAHMTLLGEQVRVDTGGGVESGICTGLTDEGYLQLDGGRRIVSGELVTSIENGNR